MWIGYERVSLPDERRLFGLFFTKHLVKRVDRSFWIMTDCIDLKTHVKVSPILAHPQGLTV